MREERSVGLQAFVLDVDIVDMDDLDSKHLF